MSGPGRVRLGWKSATPGEPDVAWDVGWAPRALSPVVVWDLDNRPRLFDYVVTFTLGAGRPRGPARTLGLWLSYRLRRCAGWSYARTVAGLARLAGMSEERVRHAVREGGRHPFAAPFGRLQLSTLAGAIRRCEVLSSATQLRDIPLSSNMPADFVLTLARQAGRDPAFADGLVAEFLEPETVGLAIKRSVEWLAKARMAGTGPAFVKIGRKVLYARDDVRAWLEAQRRTSTRDDKAAA